MSDFLASVYEWFVCLSEAGVAFLLFRKQLVCDKPKLYYAIAMLPILATVTFVLNCLDIPWVWLSLITVVVHICYAFALFKASPTLKCLWSVVPVIIYCISNYITMLVFFAVSNLGEEALTRGDTVRIIGQLIYMILNYIITVPLLKTKKHSGELPTALRVVCIVLAMIGIAVAMYGFTEFAGSENDSVMASAWIQCAAILFLSIALLFLSVYLSRLYEKNLEAQAEIQKSKLEAEHVRQVSAMYSFVQSWRHDMNGMIGTVKALAKQGKYTSMVNYLDELSDAAAETSMLISTGNPAVDATLSAKLMLARKNEITVNHTVSIPESLPVKASDICAIIMNLLDNAIEAASVLPINERWMSFSLIKKKDMLTFTVSNSCIGKYIYTNDDKIATTKTDVNAHGLGLARVASITKEYSGFFTIEPSLKSFKATVLLPLENAEK
ncbi:MAG: sensor histidine kinase [Clostridia bacterium]|nr:sensor histidine kinase [Clostridia bacterium]